MGILVGFVIGVVLALRNPVGLGDEVYALLQISKSDNVTVPLPFMSASVENVLLVNDNLQASKQVRRAGLVRQFRGEDWAVTSLEGVEEPVSCAKSRFTTANIKMITKYSFGRLLRMYFEYRLLRIILLLDSKMKRPYV